MEAITLACSVYCTGPILHSIQTSLIYNDSKVFVDQPMKYDPSVIHAAYRSIPNTSDPNQLSTFLSTYFYASGSDILSYYPNDLSNTPQFIDTIQYPPYRIWASDLNQLWSTISKQVNQSVLLYPERSSFVPRRYPMIIPGGRFHESYYWDSLWIVKGLLVCDMPQTAQYVIWNLLDDINNFGYVPNGGRIYYLDRSQPPLLSEMIISLADYWGWSSSNTTDLLTYSYPLLQKEYSWWMSPLKGHTVVVNMNGKDHVLNVYHSNSTAPRPESYLEDIETAGVDPATSSWNESTPYQQALYQNIRTGAETGWDFSSRWLHPTSPPTFNLSAIDTTHIIPTDLNTYMYRLELNLQRIALAVGEDGEVYGAAAEARKLAIEEVLWSAEQCRWNDFNITSGSSITNYGDGGVTISSWIPMWGGLTDTSLSSRECVLASLSSSGLIQDAGILTTSTNSGQQWDSPNAWPPLVLIIIEGLRRLVLTEADQLANDISSKWLATNYEAYNTSGYMYEKYNAFEVGVGGGGGEYTPQVGFGWSNGVALVLLNNSATSTPYSGGNGNDDDELSGGAIASIVIACVVFVILIATVVYRFTCFGKKESQNQDVAILAHNSV